MREREGTKKSTDDQPRECFRRSTRLSGGRKGKKADTRVTAGGERDRGGLPFLRRRKVDGFSRLRSGKRDCYQLSVLLRPRLDFHASHREVAGPNGAGDDRMRLVS